jgi:hypothetical protein
MTLRFPPATLFQRGEITAEPRRAKAKIVPVSKELVKGKEEVNSAEIFLKYEENQRDSNILKKFEVLCACVFRLILSMMVCRKIEEKSF